MVSEVVRKLAEMKGLFEKQLSKILVWDQAFPPDAQTLDCANVSFKEVLKMIDEARKDLAKNIYGFTTIHDLPRLQKKFEKWFGQG